MATLNRKEKAELSHALGQVIALRTMVPLYIESPMAYPGVAKVVEGVLGNIENRLREVVGE